jgi:hypothetical protein
MTRGLAAERRSWLLSALLALGGCATPAPDVVPIEIRIGARDARCTPRSVRAARLTFEGDFAPAPTDTVELLTASGVRELEDPRPGLRAIRVEVDGEPSFRAIGRSAFEEARASGAIAVLPPLVPCTLLDPDAIATEGAALVAHPDGTGWIVGGAGTERRIVRVDARRAFADVHPEALFNRREGASASIFGRDVILAGGAGGARDTAYDSYERMNAQAAPAGDGPGGRLSSPRRDHGAVQLGARLVLVGGRSGGDDDVLVPRIDVIDLESESASLGPALATPRTAPVLLETSDGGLAVAGGFDAAGEAVASIERVEPGLDRARTLEVSVPAPDLVVGLALDRFFHVAGREVRIVDLAVEPPRVELLSRTTEIVRPHGVATASGRVLLVGETSGARLVAELWTPHLGTATGLEVGRDPHEMLSLREGLALEVDASGASLRAFDEPGPWSSLPNDRLFFPSDLASPFVVASSPGDWDGARATRSGARLALAAIVFGTFSIELEGRGGRTLVLRGAARPISISLDAEGNAFGPGCMLSSADAPLVLSRSGARLELVRGSERVRCEDLDAEALLRVEVELERDAELSSLRVSRRAE